MDWKTSVGILCAIASGAVPIVAAAQEESATEQSEVTEARSRFGLAERHFDEGEYALALAEFERVFELMRIAQHPNASYVLYNVAFTNERMGRAPAAADAYERFLAESPNDAPNRADASRRLRELRARIALDEGQPAADQPSPSGGGVSVLGVVVAAAGAATAITGGIFGGLALSNSESARAACVDSRCPPEARGAIADAQTLANVSDGLLFGGLAVAATGVVLMFVLSNGEETAPSAGAACSGEGCVAAVGGTF